MYHLPYENSCFDCFLPVWFKKFLICIVTGRTEICCSQFSLNLTRTFLPQITITNLLQRTQTIQRYLITIETISKFPLISLTMQMQLNYWILITRWRLKVRQDWLVRTFSYQWTEKVTNRCFMLKKQTEYMNSNKDFEVSQTLVLLDNYLHHWIQHLHWKISNLNSMFCSVVFNLIWGKQTRESCQ